MEGNNFNTNNNELNQNVYPALTPAAPVNQNVTPTLTPNESGTQGVNTISQPVSNVNINPQPMQNVTPQLTQAPNPNNQQVQNNTSNINQAVNPFITNQTYNNQEMVQKNDQVMSAGEDMILTSNLAKVIGTVIFLIIFSLVLYFIAKKYFVL